MFFSFYYCNLNTTGTVYFTRTAEPFCLPDSTLAYFLQLEKPRGRVMGLQIVQPLHQ